MKKNLIAENIDLLLQAEELISEINDEQFIFTNSPIIMSCAGMHFRHILDFYSSLISGYENQNIDYDKRERDTLLSQNRKVCIKKIEQVISSLKKLANIDLSLKLSIHSIEGTTGNSCKSDSNIMRELQFLLSHTIHHYAIIAIILRSQNIHVPVVFGIARSTIEHYKI